MKPGNGDDRDLFDLDKHRLDDEWLLQPRLYRKWATKLADARQEVERAKAALDVAEAEADREVRADYAAKDEKCTEATVKASVVLHPEVRRRRSELIDAKHHEDVVDAYVTALDHRKRALEKLVDLQGRDYFAEPAAPKGTRERFDRLRDDAAFEGKRKGGKK